ncbi:NADP-dependent oxidoreductase domain-containing protein [Pelagophyceae sp. CCMP2097]|nr:NADP-dependent oxidoreductase domain-containing protein [Pelagophyceae sp. CCMP2097]
MLEGNERLTQIIDFTAGKPLGIAIDEDLRVARVNDANSPAVLSARYGVVNWRIRSVDGCDVETRSALVSLIQAKPAGGILRITLEAPHVQLQAPAPTPAAAAQAAGAISAAIESVSMSSESSSVLSAFTQRATNATNVATKRTRPDAPAEDDDDDDDDETEPSEKRLKRPTRPHINLFVKEQRLRMADDEQLRGMFRLPTFSIGGDSIPRIIAGSCTWRLENGNADRYDVAVRACASHAVVGIRTFDCGDIYAGVEDLVGRFLATARGQSRPLANCIRFHTKVVPDMSVLTRAKTLQPRERAAVVHRHIEASVWRSANRLGVSEIDLVYLHWWEWECAGFEDAVAALQRLKGRGVIKALGITNVDAEHLRSLLGEGADGAKTPKPAVDIACVQVNFSIVDRRPLDSGLIALTDRHGVKLLAHGALMGGFLSDDYLGAPDPALETLESGVASNRVLIDEFGGWDNLQQLLRTLRAVADRLSAAEAARRGDMAVPQVTPPPPEGGAAPRPASAEAVTISMVAIAWTLSIPGVAAVVLGCKDATHSRDAAYAASKLTLGPEDLAAIERAVRGKGPFGPVYGLERAAASRLSGLAGAGAEGCTALPSSRETSKAASSDHMVECALRLARLHATYKLSMPPMPAAIDFAVPEVHGTSDDWMAPWAYANLSAIELRNLLRGFVSEIDCLPKGVTAVAPTGGVGVPDRAELRTFAAKMLAASEQAIFLEARRNPTAAAAQLRRAPTNVGSHEDMMRQTAQEAQAAFRKRIVTACMESARSGTEPAAAETGCCQM